jgi:hypothetical protein
MTSLQRNTALALLALTLFGCSETKPEQTTTTSTMTTTTTTKTTRVVNLTIGMNGREAISQAGIPTTPSTLKAIDEGANVTVNYGGHAYVFSKGVLEAVH